MRDPARLIPRNLRVAFAFVVVLPPVGLTAWASGCSSSPTPADASTAPQPVCPDTLAETIGAACAVDGLACGPQYLCGVVRVTARCTCTGGVFACNDVEDAALETPEAEAACPPAVVSQACPASERAASVATCKETGLMCTYPAPCDATPSLDTCLCMDGQFQCSSFCTYLGPLYDAGEDASPDSGMPGSVADAGAPDVTSPLDGEASDGSGDARVAEASD
jgi:hypothetical protein